MSLVVYTDEEGYFWVRSGLSTRYDQFDIHGPTLVHWQAKDYHISEPVFTEVWRSDAD